MSSHVSAGGEPNLLWQDSVKVRGEVRNEITFIDFCVNYAGDKRQYVKTFAAICAILDRGDCVYIHCRSGKDRSAFTVFALLQLQYNIDEDTARAALATRIGCDGRCIANVDVGLQQIVSGPEIEDCVYIYKCIFHIYLIREVCFQVLHALAW